MVIPLLIASAVALLAAAAFALQARRRATRPTAWVLVAAADTALAGGFGLAALRAAVEPGAAPTPTEAVVLALAALLFLAGTGWARWGTAGEGRTGAGSAGAKPRFQALIESCLDLIVVLDADGTIQYASPAIRSVLGYAPDRLVGASVFPTMHPADRDRVAAFYRERRTMPGAAPVIEFRFRHKDGTWRHLEAVTSNLLDDPSVAAIVVAARDVTSRKRTEAELESLVHRLALVVDNAPLVVFALDAEGRFTLSEGRGLEKLGLRPGEVVGQSALELYREYPTVLEGLRRALAGVEGRSVARVGELVYDTWYAPLFAGDGTVSGVVGVATDVTEREQTSEALQQSEASYRALVERATYGIYRSTPAGAFVSVNLALVRMLRYDSAEDLLAADLPVDVYGDPAARSRLIDRYADAERIEGLEVEWRRKDRTPILVRLGGRPIRGPDGAIEHYEMIVEDVTERRALEEQLRQAQKMEAVGQLTGGIAHDFNNLLTVILANADILEAGLPRDRADLAADLEELRRAAWRGSDMVHKLLGYSRRGVLALQSLDLGAFVAELIPTLRRLLPETIEIRYEPWTQRAGVVADEGAVEQTLFNLVTNARDAMPEGGSLTLGVDRVTVGGTHAALEEWGATGEYVCVFVRDTGMGMDEDTKARIFEPFFTTKGVGHGTGLGMAMVYGLVKQQGGFIDVASAIGEGTTVALYFPPSALEGEDASPSAPQAEPGGGETILLVEDEEAVRRSAARALETHGYRVLVAEDGEAAVALIEREGVPVDLVISDVVMPRMGGRQLYERLRAGPHPVRFLFTSGYLPHEASAENALDPAIPFLPKPWDLQDLLVHVRRALDG